MADYDPSLALGAKGFQPQDMIAPLQAYSALQQGNLYGEKAQEQGLANYQTSKTIGALAKYADQDPNSPGALKALQGGGPGLVSQGALSQTSMANTANTQQDVEAKKIELRGQIAAGYRASDGSDAAWSDAVNQARSAGLIGDLQAADARKWSHEQRDAVTASWAGAGSRSADTSGISTRNREMNTYQRVGPAENIYAPPGLSPGFTNPAPTAGGVPTQGRSTATDFSSMPSVSPEQAGTGADPAAVLRHFEGFKAQPYWDRNALRAGYGSDTTTAADGTVSPVTPGTRVTPEDAERDLQRRVQQSQQSIIKSVGQDAWDKLTPQAQASLTSTTYNYGSLPQRLVGAVKSGDPNTIAQAIQGLGTDNGGINEGRRSIEAANVLGKVGFSPTSVATGPARMPSAPSRGQNPASSTPYGDISPAVTALGPSRVQPDLAPPVAPTPNLTQGSASPVNLPTQGRSSSDNGGAPASNSPGGLTLVRSGMTPFQLEKSRLDASRAVDEESTARGQFVAANSAQQGLLQLQDDLTKLAPAKDANGSFNFLAPGDGADRRIGIAKGLNTIMRIGGLDPIFPEDKIAAAESAAKITGRLGFDLAGGLGKGEAASIVQQAVGLNPSILTSPQGAKLLVGTLMATQQRQKDFYQFQRQYAENNGGNPIGAEVLFDQSQPPMTYVRDAQNLSRVPPAAAKYLQAHGNDQGVISEFNQQYGNGLARYYLGSRTQ